MLGDSQAEGAFIRWRAEQTHLAGLDAADYNVAMIDRLKAALNAGERLSGADAAFYQHELLERTLMQEGLSYENAHEVALQQLGHSPYELYHPDVIKAMPDQFSPAYRRWWGL